MHGASRIFSAMLWIMSRSVAGDGIIFGASSPDYSRSPCFGRRGRCKFPFGCWKSCESETEKKYGGHFYTCVSVLTKLFFWYKWLHASSRCSGRGNPPLKENKKNTTFILG